MKWFKRKPDNSLYSSLKAMGVEISHFGRVSHTPESLKRLVESPKFQEQIAAIRKLKR